MIYSDENSLQYADHRTRVGLARRERTRARLLAAALRIFAKQGTDAAVIDSIIRAAGVARGTFYNYFQTNEELFAAVAQAVSNELIRIVDPVASRQASPAGRIACGVILILGLAQRYPLLAEFVVRGGHAAVAVGSLATNVIPRDIAAAIEAGEFAVRDSRLAFDLILGPVLSALHTIVNHPVDVDYPRELAASILQSLGLDAAVARRLAHHEFGQIVVPEGSILLCCVSGGAAP